MLRNLFLAASLGLLWAASAAGQTFTFTTENNQATITGFSGAAPSGVITVPATVGSNVPVVAIGRSAFKDQTAITAITFAAPASVTRIGATAFQGCTALQSVTLPTGITVIPAGLLQGCVNLTSVSIPANVTSIGAAAFAECRSLTTLTLPTALTSLGDSAFSNCRSLASLTVPSGVAVISGQLFRECRALTSLSLAAGVTQIGYAAFQNCAGLTSFTLPTGVTSIARDAFQGCSGLTAFTINSALSSIGDRAFLGCSKLNTITVDPANATYSSLDGVLFNKDQTALLLYPAAKAGSYTAPSSVTTFGKAAFARSSALTNLTIPSSVTTLSEDALYYATGLTSVTISEGVTLIGVWTFAGSSLTNVTIPASITSIGSDAFHYSRSLTYALFNGNAPSMGTTVFDSTASGFTIYYYSSQAGFTSPTWLGYPATALTAPRPLVAFLTQYGFNPGTSIFSDPNNDGVNLLLAYALGLDPTLNLAGSLPVPVFVTGSPNTLSLTFQGDRAGVLYAAETSTDLQNWTTTGVIISDPYGHGLRTASVAVNAGTPGQFIRLVVSPTAN